MENYLSELKRLAEIIIESDLDYGRLKNATDDLYRFFLNISDFEENTDDNRSDIYLPSGKAIGPVWAAMCIKEIMRTRVFLKGILKGIKTALDEFSERPIHILYAMPVNLK
ncbi:MAG: hypothetical protein Q8920_02635 [Bacillota bacterium]|nr:hypothetical protein [Bacillota bacterium]